MMNVRGAVVYWTLLLLCFSQLGCGEIPPPPADGACEEVNLCGGCQTLEGAPGDDCGDCGSGQLACSQSGALECQTTLSPCDDGIFCNGVERCEPDNPGADNAGCVAGVLEGLDDENPCTTDLCDEASETISREDDPTCGCVSGEHLEDSLNCGCEGPCDEEDRELCQEGQCVCDADLHQEDDENCDCQGPCQEGETCQDGTCFWPCELDGCAPLGDRCEDDTRVTSDEGVCNPESGQCDYSLSEVRYDCLLDETVCRGGACVDLCQGTECSAESFCEADILVAPLASGVCDFRDGECFYERAIRTNCRSEGAVCADGQCRCVSDEHLEDIDNCGCQGSCDNQSERCLEGVCECDPQLHQTDPLDCNCEGACDIGEGCEGGGCVCDPGQHQSDDEDCACQGPCQEGTLCQGGACLWPCEIDGCPALSDACEDNVLVTVEGDGALEG